MRLLKERTEIAKAINGHKMPVITIDLADSDEFGLVSKKVLIDNGTFNDGFPYYIKSEVRAYSDESKFRFSQGCACLSAQFTYYDMAEMLEYRNAPIVKPDEDVIIAVIDSIKRVAYAPMVMHTSKRIDPNCSTPLTFSDDNYSTLSLLKDAGVELSMFSLEQEE